MLNDNIMILMKSFFMGLMSAFIVFTLYFFFYGTGSEVTWLKVLHGFGYFAIAPFYVLVFIPLQKVFLFLAGIVVFGLLFRRIGSCMRPTLQWMAYMLLILHWILFGIYSAGFML